MNHVEREQLVAALEAELRRRSEPYTFDWYELSAEEVAAIRGHLRRAVLVVERRAPPPCPPCCEGTTCHCQSCGATGVVLDEDHYCAGCARHAIR